MKNFGLTTDRPITLFGAYLLIALSLMFSLIFANAFLFDLHLIGVAPRQPDLANGYTVDFNEHGSHRFERQSDLDFIFRLKAVGIIGGFISSALSFLLFKNDEMTQLLNNRYLILISTILLAASCFYWLCLAN